MVGFVKQLVDEQAAGIQRHVKWDTAEAIKLKASISFHR
jgi:hypothetical protein